MYMLRPHIFAGASVENYMVGAFRGTPGGRSQRAANMRSLGKRLPCMLPRGRRYLENRIQFVHVDDVARLITRILQKTEPEAQRLTVLNVAGRGDPLTFERCIEVAQGKLVRLPGKFAFGLALKILWRLGIVAIPPEAAPYMTGEYLMNTERLQKVSGRELRGRDSVHDRGCVRGLLQAGDGGEERIGGSGSLVSGARRDAGAT